MRGRRIIRATSYLSIIERRVESTRKEGQLPESTVVIPPAPMMPKS